MGTIYQLAYVRQLDGADRALKDLPSIGPEWARGPERPSTASSFGNDSRKETMARLTAVPLHKQRQSVAGPLVISHKQKKKMMAGGRRWDAVNIPAAPTGPILPRPVTAGASTNSRALARLSTPTSASAGPGGSSPASSLGAGELSSAASEENLFRPRSAKEQMMDQLRKQARAATATAEHSRPPQPRHRSSTRAPPPPVASPQGPPSQERGGRAHSLHSLPGCDGLSNESKLRLLQSTHMTQRYAALTLQKMIRGKQVRTRPPLSPLQALASRREPAAPPTPRAASASPPPHAAQWPEGLREPACSGYSQPHASAAASLTASAANATLIASSVASATATKASPCP